MSVSFEAIAIFAEQIDIRGDRVGNADNGLPLNAVLLPFTTVERRAVDANAGAQIADTDTATQRDLPGLVQRNIVSQVDHGGIDLRAAVKAGRANRHAR